ncbi:class I lanthipeptide [Flavobacterium sp. LAR06]|uniref:class I lanthipeptide n=1 Tax=Flavobacterium sp. LAR06 TaxID=3064897 RepID=UPI0035C00A7C
MKKQNATNKLAFNKAAVIELNDTQMYEIDGGTGGYCSVAVIVSITYLIYEAL